MDHYSFILLLLLTVNASLADHSLVQKVLKIFRSKFGLVNARRNENIYWIIQFVIWILYLVRAMLRSKITTSIIELENAKHSSMAVVKEIKTTSGRKSIANMLV
ncbi:hypothetical protein LSH36_31g00000 [Paralvinella palmiformis]|uniref:LAGLIDADG endonuclease n=1 Tax=Paralvinella palmiformis TaxID=53620 RepID=A0AAD9K9S9_9ANNE|nr:hypothetical protein LSH36_31g00000 [Paralvinella palmiformis]